MIMKSPEKSKENETRYIQRRSRAHPQNFLLKWNNSHLRTADAMKYNWHECWGTLYPNGTVTLDFGSPYRSYTEMKEHVAQAGVFIVQWLDDGPRKLGEQESNQ